MPDTCPRCNSKQAWKAAEVTATHPRHAAHASHSASHSAHALLQGDGLVSIGQRCVADLMTWAEL